MKRLTAFPGDLDSTDAPYEKRADRPLVPQVKLPKRLDLDGDAGRALDSVPGPGSITAECQILRLSMLPVYRAVRILRIMTQVASA